MYSVKVAQKIAQVMGEIEYLKKDGKLEFGNTKYNFLSEAKITKELRDKTLKVGLIIVPVQCDITELQNSSEAVEMAYAIIDIDSGEDIIVRIAGKGQDKGDKSMYKAMTGAYKYMQRQTFAIPTGDDPDKISSDEVELEIKKDKQKKEHEEDIKAEVERQRIISEAMNLPITYGEYVNEPLGNIYEKKDRDTLLELRKCGDEAILKAMGVLNVTMKEPK